MSYFLCPVSGLILHGNINPGKATRKKRGCMGEGKKDKRKEGKENYWVFRLLVAD